MTIYTHFITKYRGRYTPGSWYTRCACDTKATASESQSFLHKDNYVSLLQNCTVWTESQKKVNKQENVGKNDS